MTAPIPTALFSTNFLQPSQTFIHTQLVHHRRYRPEVFCWRRMHADRFPYEPVLQAGGLYPVTGHSRRFHRRFAAGDLRLIHAHFAPGATYALPYARRWKLPLIVTFHGYDVPLFWNRRRLEPQYWPFVLRARALLREMGLGLCASNELKELLVELGVPAARLRVHRLGIDVDRFRPQTRTSAPPGDRPVQIVAVGRFVEKKGLSYAIRAFAPLASGAVQARLVLIGDGPRRAALEALVRELGIADRVEFAGALGHAEVARRLAASDILVAPSVIAKDGDRDSGLIVAKEAAACGLPVVATVHGGLPEIVDHGTTGLLAPERDVPALAAALRRLVEDRDLRTRMGAAGRRRMELHYDARDEVERLEEIYDEVLSGAAKRC